MTRDEFNAWYDDLKIRYPYLWEWAEGLPDTSRTLNVWFDETFSKLDLEDCMEVTRLIFVGDVKTPYGSEIPKFYGKEARKLRFARKQKDRTTETGDYGGAWRLVNTGSCAAALTRAKEIMQEEKDRGASSVEAIAIMKGDRREEWRSLVP